MTALPRPQGEINIGKKGEIKANVGERHTVDYSHSQFGGQWTYEVTRVDGGGYVFGKWVEGEVFEMDPEDCM